MQDTDAKHDGSAGVPDCSGMYARAILRIYRSGDELEELVAEAEWGTRNESQVRQWLQWLAGQGVVIRAAHPRQGSDEVETVELRLNLRDE